MCYHWLAVVRVLQERAGILSKTESALFAYHILVQSESFSNTDQN